MINKIKIKNYQSHKNTELEFSSGVNVIVGLSDSGKSSIFRSINWVNNNRPLGDDHMSDWSESMETTIETDKGIVTRKRDKKFNGYIINNENDFDGLKADVPEQVKNILNLSEINMQSQYDNHFLISSTPGAVAEYLNTIVDLQVIDDSIDRVNKRLRGINQDIKYKEKEIKKLNEDIEELSYLDELNVKVSELFFMANELDNMENEEIDINNLIAKLNSLQEEIKDKDYDEGIQKSLLLQKEIDKLENYEKEYYELEDILGTLNDLINEQKLNKNYKKGIEELTNLENEIKEVNKLIETGNEIKDLFLDNNTDELEKGNLINIIDELKYDLSTKYNLDECPLCGRSCDCKGSNND